MRGGGLPGRAAELETAGGALDAVAVGERRLLTVLGEAGIGKTRLLAEIAEQARAARFVVIEGRATELERELPLVPVIDAAERYLGDADLLSRLPADRAALLNDLADGLGEAPAEQAPGGERWRLYRALAELLPLIAADRPLLLLIDDVHWADPATEELLSYLIRRPPGDSLLIALGLRPGPIADRIRGTERSSSAVGKVHLELRPLDRPAAEPILAAIPEPGDRERIFAASGGNPMLLEELVRGGGRGEVPNGVVAAVRGELEGLAREPRTLLEAAAVAGDPFELDLASAIAGLEIADALDALDQLAGAGLVRPTERPREFGFRHPVVRTAIYEGLGAGGRLAAHAAAAEALARIEAPLPARARHLALAATAGDDDAAAVLRKAAAAVRPRAPEVAADWLLAARRAAPATIELPVLVETLVEAGRWEEALDAVDRDGAESPALAVAGASVERQLGRHEGARRRLLRAYEAAESDAPAAARIAAELAVAAYQRGEYSEISVWATRIGPAGTVGAVSAIAGILRAIGSVFAGDVATGTAELRRALEELDRADDRELAAIAEPAMVLSWGLLALDRLPDGLATAQRIATAARRGGNPLAAIPHQFAAVLALGLLGRVVEAEALADEAEQAARVSGVTQLLQWALWLRGWVLMERGELDGALDAARESVDLGAELDDSASSMVARVVLGAVLATRGEHERGRPLLDDYDIDNGWICRWAPLLVESDLALDDLDAAREHAARAAELAPGTGMAGARASAARAQALLALAEGRIDAAAALAQEAIEEADRADAALEAARARIVAGRALIAGDRDAAIAQLTVAARQAAECGAPRVENEARRELRRARGPPAAARSHEARADHLPKQRQAG